MHKSDIFRKFLKLGFKRLVELKLPFLPSGQQKEKARSGKHEQGQKNTFILKLTS